MTIDDEPVPPKTSRNRRVVDMNEEADIVILEDRIDRSTMLRLLEHGFGDMVKYVVDVQRNIIAAGGELHADGSGGTIG